LSSKDKTKFVRRFIAGNSHPTTRAATSWLSILFVFLLAATARAADPGVTLTNASDVLALSAAEAGSRIPVLLKGVVTVAETNWAGRFFMQDPSGGVFVANISDQQPQVGDVVEVSGVSHPGGYAPCVSDTRWKKVGAAPLPEAKPVSIEQIMSGTEDSQRVEISGIVRSASVGTYRLGLELASGGCRLQAFSAIPPNLDPVALVGSKVLLRGTAAASFNAPLRQLINLTLYVPRVEDFILQEAPSNPFDQPLTSLKAIAQYRPNLSPAYRVHVKGVVSYQQPGEALFLEDDTGGLQVKTKVAETVTPGQVIEAVGFPAVENYLPVLEDAFFRPTAEPRAVLKPQAATPAQFQDGLHHAEFVVLNGRLIDRLITGVSRAAAPGVRTTLVLQTTNFIFVAEKETPEQNQWLASIPIGSLLEVSGICLFDTGQGATKSIHLLLPSSSNVRLLERPSWLTPQHLLTSLAVVFAVLVAAIAWTILVSKKNSMLRSLVGEKEAAQNALQQAHDQLEDRVQERTAQLKVEMTARKESELQFRAVLTERTRLAQELHDTLEQTMSGIALQLDLVAGQFRKDPDDSFHHLKLARGLVRQSQTDVRDSVWGLRSRAMEQFNLINAIRINSRQIAGGAGLKVEVETAGQIPPLSEIVEENLLRIAQEAVSNAVKHSGAKALKVELQFTPRETVLQVADNGKGFVPENCAGPNDGHFGLLGIRERTERLGGRLSITSAPGSGATIRVVIPLTTPGSHPAPAPGSSTPTPNANHEEAA
jgi:signal transduction histidine kinase